MCGGFASFLPTEALARIFGTTNPLPNRTGRSDRTEQLTAERQAAENAPPTISGRAEPSEPPDT
jgi:hypothetical protein